MQATQGKQEIKMERTKWEQEPSSFLMAQQWKICLQMQEEWVWSLGQEDRLEKEVEFHGERSLVGYNSGVAEPCTT